MDLLKKSITIMVRNGEQALLPNAMVSLTDAFGRTVIAILDKEAGIYQAEVDVSGPVTINVQYEGYEPQSRIVRGKLLLSDIRFYLGRPGDSYTWLDGIRVPYRSYPDEIAVVTIGQWHGSAQGIHGIRAGQGTSSDVPGNYPREMEGDGQKIYFVSLTAARSAKAGASHGDVRRLLEELQRDANVIIAGSVFRKQGDESLVFSDRISIKFHAGVTSVTALRIIDEVGLAEPRGVKGAAEAYNAIAPSTYDEEVNDILDRLMAYPEVEFASANIFGPEVPEQLHPTDFLWPAIWDRIRVRCPEAWEFLRDNVPGMSFGNPNLTVGVIDSGIVSDGVGVPRHPDLQGLLPGSVTTTLSAAASPTHSVIPVIDRTVFAVGDIVDVGLQLQKLIHVITPVGGGNAGTLEIDALRDDAPAGTEVKRSGAAPRTLTTARVPAATAVITVNPPGAGAFAIGDRISIGTQAIPAAGSAVCEEVVILNIAGHTLTTTPIVARDLSGGAATHAVGVPVETGRKVVKLFDARHGKLYHHNTLPTDHGLSCATIATATANNVVGGRAFGVAGSAPNARVISIRSTSSRATWIDCFQWIAGIDSMPGGVPPWPDMLQSGVDVITCSQGIGRYMSTTENRDGIVDTTLDQITRRGRNNRGVLIFFSAGNDNTAHEPTRWSAHGRVFAVAALEMRYENSVVKDRKASYSCFSRLPNFPVAFCTPSGARSADHHVHNPPFLHRVIAGCIPGTGNRMGRPTLSTTLKNPVAARTEMKLTMPVNPGDLTLTVDATATVGVNDWLMIGHIGDPNIEWVRVHATIAPSATVITLNPANLPVFGHPTSSRRARVIACSTIDVVAAAGFAVNDWIQLGDPSARGSEAVRVQAVNLVANTLTVDGPLNAYTPTVANPVNVHRGNGVLDYYDTFNGTSAATPLAAGIGGLMLAAKPTLTWVEVRDILAHTALRVDLTNHEMRAAAGPIAVPNPLPAAPAIDGRWINRQSEPVVDATGELLQYSDDKTIDEQPTATTLVLDDINGMHVDHAVELTNAANTVTVRRIIVAVDVPSKRITIDVPLANDFTNGEAVTGFTEIAAGAPVGATLIQVDSSASFVTGQTIEINSLLYPAEVRVVRSIPDATHLEVDPLERSIHNNENVYGGLIPHTSPWYGIGSLDAYKAVRGAFEYNHDARDLMIRNNAGDQGIAAINDLVANPIDSPDIWGRILAPVIPVLLPDAPGDGNNALPLGYREPGYDQALSYANRPPHQRPKNGQNYYLYARICNRGNTLESLNAWVRFYVFRTRTDEPFRISQGWNDGVAEANLAVGNSGTFFVGSERPLFNAPADENLIALNGGIRPGEHFIVKTVLGSASLPPAGQPIANRLRTHILVEVTPHDGLLAGNTVGANNNISSREVSFAEVTFLKDNGDPIPKELRVKRAGGESALAFKIDVNDPIGYFRVGKVKILCTRRATDGATETVVYGWGGAPQVWMPNPGPAAWFTVAAPTLPGGAAAVAANDEIRIEFTGTLKASKLHDKVEIKLIVESHNGVVIIEEIAPIVIEETPVRYSDLDVGDPNAPSLYAFADMAGLTQTTPFGPVDDNKFRVTSSFNATAGTKVYAVASGEVLVQRVWKTDKDADGYKDEVVNIILKPFHAPRIGSRAVKYFVYRGLRLTDILKNKDEDTKVREETGSADFIKALYRYQNARRQAFLATDYGAAHPTEAPPQELTGAMLGWDATVASATELDAAFFGSDTAPQLPIVSAGMQFGEFVAGVECGFEVALEKNGSVHTYAYARRASMEIDVSADAAGSLVQRHHREEVLRYADPAAYYGAQFAIGVYAKNGATRDLKKGAALYTDILRAFTTKSRLYLDIRNEADMSFDFYGNYINAGHHLKYGTAVGKLEGKVYATQGWPILILDRKQAERAADKIYLSLSMNGNKKPALYIESGIPVTKVDGTSFVVDGKLFTPGEGWTKEIGLKVNQHTAAGGAKEDVSGILLLDYGRRVDSTYVWPPASPIVKFEQYTDNVFGPVNTLMPWVTDPARVKTRWVRLHDLRFVDGVDNDPALAFGSVVDRGVAFQPGQVVFFNAALDYYKRNNGAPNVTVGSGIEGGFSPQPNLLSASSLFYGLDIRNVQIKEVPAGGGAPVVINTIRLETRDQATVPESVMLLGLSEGEYNTIIGLAGLSDKHPKNIVLKEQLPGGGATHQNDGTTDYHRYAVELRGLDEATATSKDVGPGAPILVYSVDGLIFLSRSFDSTQLIPTTYVPDHEESRAMGKPEPEDRIVADSDITNQLNLFIDGVNQIPEGSATAKADLQTLVFQYAPGILTRARTFTVTPAPGDTYQDDRALYWARLRMAVALKGHPYIMKNAADRDELVRDLEWLSRGLDGVSFAAAAGRKKILLCGTDPIGLNNDVTASNPSAVIALALHGQEVEDAASRKGYVQSVILPMRYRDFDNGLVDEFFTQYLYNTPADMVVTLSQNGAARYFDLERFASLKRGTNRDNDDQIDTDPVGAGAGWSEFYETSLPVSDMMAGQKSATPRLWYYDQSFNEANLVGTIAGVKHPAAGGPDEEDNAPGVGPAGGGLTSAIGSAGDFLANELFYRLMHLAATPTPPFVPSSVKAGHLSIPTPAAAGMTMTAIIAEVRTMLARALAGL